MSNTETRAHMRRFVDEAEADPRAYAQYVRNLTGFDPQTTEALLAIHRHLHHGGSLDDSHVKTLQRAHPQVKEVPALARELNKLHAGQRADAYLALLAGDLPAVAGRVNEAGSTLKDLHRLTEAYHREGIAEELQRRRDGGTLKPAPAERPADPTSTRAILEQQFEPAGARRFVEAVERGDPQAAHRARNFLADRVDAASARLADDKTDLRGHVEAAYDIAAIEDVGQDEGWLPEHEG